MPGETELKIGLDEDARIAAEPLFVNDTPVLVESTYFDTPDLDLRRHGVQLRVRRDGNRLLQTVKMPHLASGPLTRDEYEIPLEAPEPDLDHLTGLLPDALKSETGGTLDLQSIFVTRFTRRRHMVSNGSAIAEAALDEGEIVSGEHTLPIREMEIELKGADMAAYVGVCEDMLRRVGGTLIMEGKAARGYRLASGLDPQPTFSRKLAVEAGAVLPEAIRAMMRHNFQHFLDNVPAVEISGVPESIHQLRVGLRRLRSVITSFKPVLDTSEASDVLAAAKRLFGLAGAVRELDVFMAETLPAIARRGLDDDKRETVEAVCRDRRAKALAAVREELAKTGTAVMAVRLTGWIEAGHWLRHDKPVDRLLASRHVRDFATPRLRGLHKKLIKKGHKARAGTLDDWHAMRIAVKKLRYTAEPLLSALPIAPEEAEAYRKRVEKMQDCLGRLNDLNTAEDLLDTLHKSSKGNSRKAVKAARSLMHDWAAEEADDLIRQAGKALRDFERRGFPAG
ncbi:CHAD domain-containing protein [Kaustia mangrovi]|uniref:CHAD domain-containing protein n=1 Tax=Kaustia mangrovi TaxID=2593653 RepID=A0A7S8C4X8_9HYPH|nr:CYTH and CHAD domain-containing protein [Kaustia mangrovi]QPC43401.1 CHAD domain-containing protein [Kaustia mangrovi]